MELNFNVDKRPPPSCPLDIKGMSFLRNENYHIWGQISTLKIDPQRSPCWKIDTFWRHFSTGASIFNDRVVLFYIKFQLKNDRAGHFLMGGYFQRYTGPYLLTVILDLIIIWRFYTIVVNDPRMCHDLDPKICAFWSLCILHNYFTFGCYFVSREKGRDLTQSYDKSPYTHRKKKTKNNVATQKRHQKLRLHNECGLT